MVCRRSLILLGFVSVVIFHGCEKNTLDAERFYGDSLVFITYHAPTGINPLTSESGISAILVDVVFDPLVRIGENLEARPSLASSWETSENGLRWTFYLRRGVTFHDGVEFTAEDVKFSFEEILHSSSKSRFRGSLTDSVRSINIKDRYTVEFLLNKPSIFFIYNMEVGILPAHLLKGKSSQKEFGFHPVGTGPFKLTQWKDDEIVFDDNKDYFLGRPYLDRIIVRIYPDQELAWARLMRADGDMFGPVDPTVYDFLKQVNSLEIKSHRLYYSMIVFNNNSEPFNDRRVRVALNYAIDKEHIIQDVLKRKGQVAAGTIWPGSWFYDPSVNAYPYNPQKALSLLREAGWMDRDGDQILDKKGKKFIFTLLINEGDEIKERVTMYIKQQLWELGIVMNIKTFSIASIDLIFHGNFNALYIDIFSHLSPDFSYNLWHSSQIRKGFNIWQYRSEIVDNLLERGRVSKDIEEARRIYYRFQEEMYDNPPGIFLYWADILIGVHKRFRGVRFPPGKPLAYINEWYVPEGEQKSTDNIVLP